AITFSSAVSTQNLALFALALLAAFVLVATTGYIAARRRHAEFGLLRALGWPSWRIGGLVASEMGWLGLTVGFVTVVVTLVGGLLLRAPVATPLLAATLPIAIGVALAALTVAIAALGAGQVVSLSYLERRPQLAVLRALGWSRTDLGAMIAVQVVVIACVALALSASLVFAAATLTSASAEATWTAL